MRVAALVELVVGVAHGFRLGAADHHLEINRLKRIVLIAVDHASGARDALPGAEPRGDALAGLVLDEHVEMALQHEEALLDLVEFFAGITVGSSCLPEPPAPMKRCCARLKPSILASSKAAQSPRFSLKRPTNFFMISSTGMPSSSG